VGDARGPPEHIRRPVRYRLTLSLPITKG
jgi:hypothetical protein